MIKIKTSLIIAIFALSVNVLFPQDNLNDITKLDTIIDLKEIPTINSEKDRQALKLIVNEKASYVFKSEPVDKNYIGVKIDDKGYGKKQVKFDMTDVDSDYNGIYSVKIKENYAYLLANDKFLVFNNDTTNKDEFYSLYYDFRYSERYLHIKPVNKDTFLLADLHFPNFVVKKFVAKEKEGVFSKDSVELKMIKKIKPDFGPSIFTNVNPNNYIEFSDNEWFILRPADYKILGYNNQLEKKNSVNEETNNWNKIPASDLEELKSYNILPKAMEHLHKIILNKKRCYTFASMLYQDDNMFYVLKENYDTCYHKAYDIWKKENNSFKLKHRNLAVNGKPDNKNKEMNYHNFPPLLRYNDGYIDYTIRNNKIYLLRIDSKISPLGLTYNKWWENLRKKEILDDEIVIKLYVYEIDI